MSINTRSFLSLVSKLLSWFLVLPQKLLNFLFYIIEIEIVIVCIYILLNKYKIELLWALSFKKCETWQRTTRTFMQIVTRFYFPKVPKIHIYLFIYICNNLKTVHRHKPILKYATLMKKLKWDPIFITLGMIVIKLHIDSCKASHRWNGTFI